MKVLMTSQQIKNIENSAFADGVAVELLMDRAGSALAEEVEKAVENRTHENLLVLCGKGNNGGDGFVAADKLTEIFKTVYVYMPFGLPKTRRRANAFEKMNKAVKITGDLAILKDCDTVIDRLFGFSFHGDVNRQTAEIIRAVNRSGAFVISADVPSGLECDSGKIGGDCINADVTVTFSASKPMEIISFRAEKCGKIIVKSVGLEKYIEETVKNGDYYGQKANIEYIKDNNPKRSDYSNKGTFGKLLCVTGSYGMPGAAVMSAGRALKSGTGLLYQVTGRENYPIYAVAMPQAVMIFEENLQEKIKAATAVLLGCGLGMDEDAESKVKRVLSSDKPVVIDADGLNILAKYPEYRELYKGDKLIITPHPGEAARLLNTEIRRILADPAGRAAALSEKYDCTAVLKGAVTVIKEKNKKPVFAGEPNSGLAKGGSGDVLAGIISSLLAQGNGCFTSRVAGVRIHRQAGKICRTKYTATGMQAVDLINRLPEVFKIRNNCHRRCKL